MKSILETNFACIHSFGSVLGTVTIIIKSGKNAKLKTTMFSNKLLIYYNSVICNF